MPIRPIDLQTLLMQMSQVGRDQANEKDGPAIQASVQGAVALRKQGETKEAVRGPEEPKEGLGAVADRSGKGAEKRRGEGEKGSKDEDEPPAEEVVRDPELGNKVDLSG